MGSALWGWLDRLWGGWRGSGVLRRDGRGRGGCILGFLLTRPRVTRALPTELKRGFSRCIQSLAPETYQRLFNAFHGRTVDARREDRWATRMGVTRVTTRPGSRLCGYGSSFTATMAGMSSAIHSHCWLTFCSDLRGVHVAVAPAHPQPPAHPHRDSSWWVALLSIYRCLTYPQANRRTFSTRISIQTMCVSQLCTLSSINIY